MHLCYARGCDADAERRNEVVWRDGKVETVTCPVKAFSPEVENYIAWFVRCYRLETDPISGISRWERFALPGAGGVGNQDARLWFALEHLAQVSNEILMERRAEELARTKRETSQRKRTRESG